MKIKTYLLGILACIFLLGIANAIDLQWGSNQWESRTMKAAQFPVNLSNFSSKDTYKFADICWTGYCDLKLWLTFDDLSGSNPLDKSNYSWAVGNNGAAISTGNWNQSMFFNSTTAYMNLTSFDNGNNYDQDALVSPPAYDYPFTVSFWEKTNKTKLMTLISDFHQSTSIPVVFAGWTIQTNAGGLLQMQFGTGSGAGNNPIMSTGKNISDGKWHHIVYSSANPLNHLIYLDGVLLNTSSVNMSYNVNRKFYLGANKLGTSRTNFFNGSIDDMLVFSRTLNADEIKSLNSTISGGGSVDFSEVMQSPPNLYRPIGYEVNHSYAIAQTADRKYYLDSLTSCYAPNPGDSVNWYVQPYDACYYSAMFTVKDIISDCFWFCPMFAEECSWKGGVVLFEGSTITARSLKMNNITTCNQTFDFVVTSVNFDGTI